MKRRKAIALSFCTAIILITSIGTGTALSDSKSLQADEPVSYNDFSELDFSTPKKAAISFIDQLNGVMPGSPLADLREICAKVVQPSCHKDCMSLLEARLKYVKSISGKLKGAHFVPKSLTQEREFPMEIKAVWKEQLTFTDSTRQFSNKVISVVLEKIGEEWKIIQIKMGEYQ